MISIVFCSLTIHEFDNAMYKLGSNYVDSHVSSETTAMIRKQRKH
jgi:hypothetical protein